MLFNALLMLTLLRVDQQLCWSGELEAVLALPGLSCRPLCLREPASMRHPGETTSGRIHNPAD